MRRTLFVILAAAACGGSSKPTTPLAPLPETKPEPVEAKADPKPEPKPPAPPPAPSGPIEVTVPAPKVTVKLVSPGKGKRSPVKLSAKTGAKQQVELAMDFAGKQTAPPELGGTQEQVAPTLVLVGEVSATDVDKDGAAQFQVTFSGADARDAPGAKTPAAEFKQDLVTLSGMTIAGKVDANGSTGDLTMRIEKPDGKSQGALDLVKLSLMPIWPVLPAEPIAVGAKWQVTQSQKIADQLEVTKVTDYELVAHKGTVWTIKGTAKVTGADQDIQGAKFGAIGGSGSSEMTVSDGVLMPASSTKLETDFTATAAPPDKPDKPVSLQFHLKQGNTLK